MGDTETETMDVGFNIGRIKPLIVWPETRLTTLIAQTLGYTHYNQLPTPSLSAYSCFMSPLCYLIVFDLEGDAFNVLSVRHGRKEGSSLRTFRSACRRFFGREQEDLESDFVQLAVLFLAYCAEKPVTEEYLDALVEDAAMVHFRMSKKLVALHASHNGLSSLSAKIFQSAGDVLDGRLPTHLARVAAAAEKAEANRLVQKEKDKEGGSRYKRQRDQKSPTVKEGNFWCFSCEKEFPKADKDHRISAEHVANAKKRF